MTNERWPTPANLVALKDTQVLQLKIETRQSHLVVRRAIRQVSLVLSAATGSEPFSKVFGRGLSQPHSNLLLAHDARE